MDRFRIKSFDDIDKVCEFDYPRTNYLCAGVVLHFKSKSAIKFQLTYETILQVKSYVPRMWCINDEFMRLVSCFHILHE